MSTPQNDSFAVGGASGNSVSPRTKRNVTFDVRTVKGGALTSGSISRRPSSSGCDDRYGSPNSSATSNPSTHDSPTPPPPFCLTREDVLAAFEFFDVDGVGSLTMASLKPRLSAFYPDLTSKEYRFLLDDPVAVGGGAGAGTNGGNSNSAGGSGFTADHLWELIDSYQRLYMSSSSEPVASPSASAPNSGRLGGGGGGGGGGHTASGRPISSSSTMAGATGSLAGATGAAVATASQVFDPVYEAFRVYDPTGKKRCVDVAVLSQIMARIGYGQLNNEEMRLLVRTADYDGDGKISLEDFRHLVSAKDRLGGGGGGSNSSSRKDREDTRQRYK